MSWKMNLEELVAGTQGKVISQHTREFSGVGTDTRQDLSGKIFVALKGDTFDANQFLTRAFEANAAAVVTHDISAATVIANSVTVILVDDTLKAIQKLGNFWRRKMPAFILGVTGTNGKTTTKEFTAALIASKKNVQYSKGSFNNHWGVPISLLSIEPKHEVAVIEMGMNHPGELKDLSQIAEPDAVLCTMVGRGHLEGVGSIEGVAKAKAEIYQYAPEKSFRIFNIEDEHTRKMFETFGKNLPAGKVLTFASQGEWPSVDVSFEIIDVGLETLKIRGQIQGVAGETSVPVFGKQNVTNLMAASCFALVSGLTPAEVWAALPRCKNTWGRNQWVDLQSGARALFDAYNANPESMRAAIENFGDLKIKGRKFAVLGEMRELGDHAPKLHFELGVSAAKAGFEQICFVGPNHEQFTLGLRQGGFTKTPMVSASYEQSLATKALPVLDQTDLVLIKGSRGMQLEKALADLKPVSFESKK
ncbi:MAG: UDP-N-acetylmuramoyl-tripeptide--D-alanyl-D-alanine ligase [Bdellovibrionota bacterium]